MKAVFSQSYPAITRWIEKQGWIEIGIDEYSISLVRALDPGGMVWESDDAVETVDEALQGWFERNGMNE